MDEVKPSVEVLSPDVSFNGELKKIREPSEPLMETDASRAELRKIQIEVSETKELEKGPDDNALKRKFTSEGNSESDYMESAPSSEKKKKMETSEQQEEFDPEKCRKRKVAVLLGYSGSGYFGMQKNPGVKTIEHDLVNAFFKASAIKEEVKDDMGKMIPNTEMISRINEHLPSGIRVFDIKRVTRSFDSKNQCCARTYEYLLPSFAFAPTYMETTSHYRIKDHILENVTFFLKRYEGTHNFHNFTSGRLSTDPSSHRYITSFKASKPFVRKGHEFIVLSVKGQSFILHQIRKMIGLCIAYCRGHCGIEALDKAWGRDKVHYNAYNKRFGRDGIHEPLSWEDKEEEILQFKENFIWSTIIDTEITQHSMMRWLSTLTNHTYNEEGIIRSLQKKALREQEMANDSSDEDKNMQRVDPKTEGKEEKPVETSCSNVKIEECNTETFSDTACSLNQSTVAPPVPKVGPKIEEEEEKSVEKSCLNIKVEELNTETSSDSACSGKQSIVTVNSDS